MTPELHQVPAGPELGASSGSPPFTERFRGSGRRFEWRVYGTEQGQRYEVYAPGLIQVAECLTPEGAEMVCNALNALPENTEERHSP